MSVPEHESPAVESYVRLQVLGMHLRAHGFTIHHVAGGLVVRNMTSTARSRCGARGVSADTITCRPREEDEGRYWYFTSWRQPIAEAERITDALVMIKGYLGAPA
ncbi:hypothetical protein ACFQY7_52095 [Actinomadura luteofluorescens]|uniref:Uncharacterized protein n=1 Tax=Actinomadura luteofluorescens TaxID=46163 RepID=A0A7Y9JFA2_9ACTN|nr:hypothetical protein [Actinomadura luteofluorescens]NYD46311.1 hypothetical protein [Actinomadura luteofluorescens]